MMAVSKRADKINELCENLGWNLLSPLKSRADSIERAQRSLDDTMFMLKSVKWMGHCSIAKLVSVATSIATY